MSLAIFDLDNTLIAGDSDHTWGEFLIAKELVDPHTFKQANDQFYEDYKNGCLDIFAYQEFALQPLTALSLERLHELHQEFMASWVTPLWLPKAEALLDQHRAQGDTLLVITATNRFVTGPIVERLGVEHLLATEPEIIEQRYTGKIVDVPCFQDGKVTRLTAWLKSYNGDLNNSYFYSDSANDIPLLTQVDNPVAVDPDPRLREYAEQYNIPIISLRE